MSFCFRLSGSLLIASTTFSFLLPLTGLPLVYKHCGSLLKREGDAVKGGEAIALVGNTGELSTGPHLHFELWHKGRAVNPELYIVF